jgi:hypothetical protein
MSLDPAAAATRSVDRAARQIRLAPATRHRSAQRRLGGAEAPKRQSVVLGVFQ